MVKDDFFLLLKRNNSFWNNKNSSILYPPKMAVVKNKSQKITFFQLSKKKSTWCLSILKNEFVVIFSQ